MKNVTAVLLVYAIIVIASCVFWVWSAFSKSRPAAESDDVHSNVAAEAIKVEQDAETISDETTELTVGVTDVKADGRVGRRCEVKRSSGNRMNPNE